MTITPAQLEEWKRLESAAEKRDLIAEALSYVYGDECPDFDADCLCCRAWSELTGHRTALPALIAEVERLNALISATADWQREELNVPLHQRAAPMSDIVERLFRWSKFGYGVDASCDMVRAADTITTLRATISRLEGEKAKLREAIRSMNEEATAAIQAEPLPEFSQYSNHDDLPQGLRTHAHIKLAMLRATGRLALAETGEKPAARPKAPQQEGE